MEETNIIVIDADVETICCDGEKDGLGHPAVYFNFKKQDRVVCNYCDKIYIKKKENIKNV
ncbi:MAG: hypothetical protein CFH19_00134 [Alphaproteobacteria bacterium MarineAlpha5_Bin9]|nr:MAG: hypothetical protein CFH19_00134 [Alphaproteobacteria bacterium MarineAlpha5_Bin9]|tara:strand:- start:7370 stop:7549 length:180 start_codon:yes stop_codon:yes gene_type:complete